MKKDKTSAKKADITQRNRDEKVLSTSEGKLRAVFEFMAAAAVITDLKGRIIDVNSETCKLYGCDNKQEFIGMKASDLVAEIDRDRAIKDSIDTLKTGESRKSEYKLTTKGGVLFDGELSAAVMRDHSGNPIGFIGISRDISDRKSMEEELSENERKLRTVFGAMMDGLVITDMMGTIIEANEAAARIGKYKSVKDLIGRDGADFVTQAGRKKVEKALLAVIADPGKMYSEVIEYIAQDIDGNPFYGESSAAVIRNSSGEPVGIVFVTRDITERKKMEEELRRSKEKYQTLTETTNDILYSIDNMGNLTFIGPQISRYDMDTEKMIGRHFLDFVHPEDREKLALDVERTLTTNEEFPTEFRVLDAAGNAHWLEEVGKVRRDSSGAIIGITGMLRDITERKQAEEALKKNEEKLRVIFDSITSGICMTDMQGNIIEVNDALVKLAGFDTSAELIGRNVIEFIASQYREIALGRLASRARLGHGPELSEYKLIRRDGVEVDGELSIGITHDKKGESTSLVVIIRDITKRKQAEEALAKHRGHLEELVDQRTKELIKAGTIAENANKAKSEFLANMSHEIRTPLNSIIGFSETLYDEIEGPLNEEQKKHLGIITSNGHHLLSLINDILDLSKIEAGKMDLLPTSFSMSDVLKNSLSFFKEKAVKHNLRLTADVSADIGKIEADERKVKQIVNNLLSNAVKFTPDGGSITLRAHIVTQDSETLPVEIREGLPDMECVVVSVKDTGIGIAKKYQKKLFIEFSQIEEPYAKKYEGTGLGLALSKKMVELHSGKIWFESEGKGKGCIFYFVLPTKVLPKS